jgi:hypothetical protein
MKKNFLQASGLILLVVSAISCANQTQQVEKTPIIAECYLRFLADQNQSLSEVSIYQQVDSVPQIIEVKEVRLNGNSMEVRELPGFGKRYQFTETLLAGKEVNWSLKIDENSPLIKTSLRIPAVKNFSFPDGVSKTDGTLLKMESELFSSNESLRILFTPVEGKTASVEIPGLPGKNEINIPGEALISLTPGPNKVEIIRKKILIDKVDNITFNKVGEFYSGPMEVEVTE